MCAPGGFACQHDSFGDSMADEKPLTSLITTRLVKNENWLGYGVPICIPVFRINEKNGPSTNEGANGQMIVLIYY